MFNNQVLQSSIGKAWTHYNGLNLGLSYIMPSALPVEEQFRMVALDPQSTYSLVYRTALFASHYNFILRDHSFFQFSNQNNSLRYAYYPSPIPQQKVLEETESLEAGLYTYDEYLERITMEQHEPDKPLVRYEYAPSQFIEDVHPTAHFHIGLHSNNRWPIASALTPEAFALLIGKLYYSEHLDTGELVAELDTTHILGISNKLRTSKRDDCRNIPDDLFTPLERQGFYFG